ncbi:MAG TPA: VOC family protein [Nitrososphaeraceae archaeon]|jgi:catechol 2,3-dioxygenase-like lactoylglutathione lyase family enzyme|nr:VOC family protein [Nitrososphaeraceae archaeon]
MFSKIGSVIVLVEDMERSTLFYKDTLGLKLKVKTTDWIEFFEKGTTLALHPRREGLPEKIDRHSNILVGFMVSDLDQVVKDLKAKNVRFFKEPKNEPFGKHAIILDPDDHLISIAEIQTTKSTEEFDLIGFLGAE